MGREIINALTPDQLRKQDWYSDYINLMGQLLAWCYLSDHGHLSDDLRFNSDASCFTDQSLVADNLADGLSRVSLFRKDPLWHSAWSDCQQNIQAIPPSELVRLTLSLATARRHGLLNYGEIPLALSSKYSQIRPGLPTEVSELIVNLLPLEHQENLYLCGDTASGLVPFLSGQNIPVFSEHPTLDALHSLIALMGARITLKAGDAVLNPSFLRNGGLRSFSCGAGILLQDHRYKLHEVRDLLGRFKPESRQKETLFISHMLLQCRGAMVLAVPGQFLLKNTAESQSFRKKLIKEGRLSSVIRLPAGLLPGRGRPMFLLVFSDQASDTIRFINGASDYFKSVAVKRRGEAKYRLTNHDVIIEEWQAPKNTRVSYEINRSVILESGRSLYPLDPAYYVGTNHSVIFRSDSTVTEPLDNAFEIIRAQAVGGSELDQDCRVFMEVANHDINDAGLVESPKRVVHVGADKLSRAKGQQLQPGDILLAIKGQTGRLALVPEFCGNNWIAGQSFVILRQKTGNLLCSPVVLFRFLKSETGQKLLDAIRTDSSVPFIHSRDLKQLPLPCWSELEQKQACLAHEEVLKLYARVKFFREKAEMIEKEILKEA